MIPIFFFILLLISLILLIYFNYKPKKHFYLIFKTLTSLFFIFIAITSYINSGTKEVFFYLILAALIFSLFGDVFLALYDKKASTLRGNFVKGVLCFAAAHILFSLAFLTLVPLSFKELVPFFILVFLSIIFLCKYKRFQFDGMLPIIISYDIVISFMVARAFYLYRLISVKPLGVSLLISGAALFLISDVILCFIYFDKKHPPYLSALNLSTYYIGQGLIALSILGSL